MSEEPTTPNLEETARRSIEAFNRRDLDAWLAMWAADAVRDFSSALGMALLEVTPPKGHEPIRKFAEEVTAPFEDWETAIEELQNLGNGVTFTVIVQRGRLLGSSRFVVTRFGAATIWREGLIARTTNYTDIDEARAAAERLAEERG